MPNIFTYQNYRQFLTDYYEEKKSDVPTFSYQNFSRKAGFSSKSFVFNVIKGTKNLSSASIVGLCAAMNLSKGEAEFFENLVFFNQASNFKERAFYFEKLNSIHPVSVQASSARQLREDQYEFYSQWYTVAIRSLIDLYPSVKDAKNLGKMIYPPLNTRQVQKSIDLLIRLGLVIIESDGTYRVSSKMLSTGPDLQKLAVQQFHIACMKLAENALIELPSDKRNFSGMTLGISKNAYNKISEELIEFQKRVMAIAEADSDSDMIYQLNFQLFPMSNNNKSQKQKISADGTIQKSKKKITRVNHGKGEPCVQ